MNQTIKSFSKTFEKGSGRIKQIVRFYPGAQTEGRLLQKLKHTERQFLPGDRASRFDSWTRETKKTHKALAAERATALGKRAAELMKGKVEKSHYIIRGNVDKENKETLSGKIYVLKIRKFLSSPPAGCPFRSRGTLEDDEAERMGLCFFSSSWQFFEKCYAANFKICRSRCRIPTLPWF